MKKKKVVTYLSEESLKNLFSFKTPFYLQEKPISNLTAKSLSYQKVKRIKATSWHLYLSCDKRGQKRVCRATGRVLKLDKNIRKLIISQEKTYRQLVAKDKAMLHLANSFKGLKTLREITLSIEDYTSITDVGLANFTKRLKRLCWLKRIFFRFSHLPDITDIGFDSLSRGFKFMKFLENVHLDVLFLPQITAQGLSELNGCLSHLMHMRNITISTIFEKMTDVALSSMKLKRLVSLKELSLIINGCHQLTDKGLSSLAQNLMGLPNLQRVRLDFFECKEFSDEGLCSIWEMMNNLPSLQFIDLLFSHCSKIRGESFKKLNKSRECLQEFSLVLLTCHEINDSSLASLCEGLKKLKYLERLNVGLVGCPITAWGFKKFIHCTSRLEYLRDLEIDIVDNHDITFTSLKEISQFVQSPADLESVTLHAAAYSDETEEDIEKLIVDIKAQRPDLTIIIDCV